MNLVNKTRQCGLNSTPHHDVDAALVSAFHVAARSSSSRSIKDYQLQHQWTSLDGSDLLKASVRQELDHEIDRLDPYVITFSPLCGPWGPWSKLNMSKNEVTREKIRFVDGEPKAARC